MIVSASRRTDIPALYSDWFFNRLKERYVLVRSPYNAKQVSRISLTPEVVDGIVFMTKNPLPMLERLDELKDYAYYFQFTLNPYGTDIEPNVPSKNDCLIPAFCRLSDKIGPERLIWRYDPILLNSRYTVGYHIEYYERMAAKLKGYTRKCTISFVDYYLNTVNNIKELGLIKISAENKELLAKSFSAIARGYGMEIDTCAEDIELDKYGITHARCIDVKLFEKMTGYSFKVEKARSQRPYCCCSDSVDIGMYNTCSNGCLYCYANFNSKTVNKNVLSHDPASPLLCGNLSLDDKVTERKMKSCKLDQLNLFSWN